MSILYAATSLADIDNVNISSFGVPAGDNTASFISPYCGEGFGVFGGGNAYGFKFNTLGNNEFYMSYYMMLNSGSSVRFPFGVVDASNNYLFYARRIFTPAYGYEFNVANGPSTYTVVGTAAFADSRHKVDFYFKYAVAGRIKMYIDGVLVLDYTGDTTLRGAPPDAIRCTASGDSGDNYHIFSGVVVATEETRFKRVSLIKPSATGSESAGFTGAASALADSTVNDSSYIESTTTNSVFTFTSTAFPTGADVGAIDAVFMSIRSLAGSNNGVKGVAKVGSTIYESDSPAAANSVFGNSKARFDVNPSTGVKWTFPQVASAQFGVKVT